MCTVLTILGYEKHHQTGCSMSHFSGLGCLKWQNGCLYLASGLVSQVLIVHVYTWLVIQVSFD